MWIFISNIPEQTSHKELAQFITEGLQSCLTESVLPSRKWIAHCEMMRIIDRDNGAEEFHGLAEIEPEVMHPGILDQLSSMSLNGKQVEVHKYQHRSPNRDRRATMITPPTEISDERRGSDRRRRHLRIDILEDSKK
ncbi:MAG: hypothetical protein ABW089_04015 [Sedimenticola sp.]